jgi:hypothetical protein
MDLEQESYKDQGQVEEATPLKEPDQEIPLVLDDLCIEEMAVDGICGIY